MPGDYSRHPICLLKLDEKYIFVEEGIYRLRATLRPTPSPRAVPPQYSVESINDSQVQEPAPRSEWNSDWIEIEVRPIGKGRPNYVHSHPWQSVACAFSCRNGLESIQAQLPRFFDYQHEQEKLLVYQFDRRAVYGLRDEQVYNDEMVKSAKEMLSLARKTQVGILMWEWIVEQLEQFPREVESRRKYNAKNGYNF